MIVIDSWESPQKPQAAQTPNKSLERMREE